MLKNKLAKYQSVVEKIKRDHPTITFVDGDRFSWNPETQTIITSGGQATIESVWSLLHEIAHAKLRHSHFLDDYQLVLFEVAAWQEAKQMADSYEVVINNDYAEDCIDSYRDWLYLRSKCPNCSQVGIQKTVVEYQCINCHVNWKVPKSQACSVKRVVIKK